MRAGQVRDRQLAALGVAGIAVHGEPFRPIPHAIAELGHVTELLVQADLGDPMDVAQRFGVLEAGRMAEPSLERFEDLGLAEPASARAAQRKNERKAEPRLVVGVQRADPRELPRRARGEALLLARRLARQRRVLHRAAGELRVRADQRELRVGAGLANDLHERALECGERAERPRGECALGNPRRMLVSAVEQRDELGRRCAIQLFQRKRHACLSLTAVRFRYAPPRKHE